LEETDRPTYLPTDLGMQEVRREGWRGPPQSGSTKKPQVQAVSATVERIALYGTQHRDTGDGSPNQTPYGRKESPYLLTGEDATMAETCGPPPALCCPFAGAGLTSRAVRASCFVESGQHRRCPWTRLTEAAVCHCRRRGVCDGSCALEQLVSRGVCHFPRWCGGFPSALRPSL